MEILNREEPAYPINEEDSEQQDIADMVKPLVKILGRILIDRIHIGIDHRLRKEQAGFRSGRGTTSKFSSYAIY